MANGTITIESGENKAIFNFNGNQCSIDFEPAIDTKKEQLTEEESFVHNIAEILVKYLIYQTED